MSMPHPLKTWWFWIFVAPEALLFIGWLVFVIFAGIGFGAAAGWRRAFGPRDGEPRRGELS